MKFEFDQANPPPLTDKQIAALEALTKMPDSEINYSDIPDELLYRPAKKMTTVRLDADVLAWLRTQGKGYQTRINAILRREMLSSNQRCNHNNGTK
ncbi:MAG: BrnA antitoxin family protein [Deltaproteobacteria bacterium]|nr:BrnA antitoxin family protein [Deltaproteobacteria bacterium]